MESQRGSNRFGVSAVCLSRILDGSAMSLQTSATLRMVLAFSAVELAVQQRDEVVRITKRIVDMLSSKPERVVEQTEACAETSCGADCPMTLFHQSRWKSWRLFCLGLRSTSGVAEQIWYFLTLPVNNEIAEVFLPLPQEHGQSRGADFVFPFLSPSTRKSPKCFCLCLRSTARVAEQILYFLSSHTVNEEIAEVQERVVEVGEVVAA